MTIFLVSSCKFKTTHFQLAPHPKRLWRSAWWVVFCSVAHIPIGHFMTFTQWRIPDHRGNSPPHWSEPFSTRLFLHVQFTHFQLASRPTRPWCSSRQVQPQDSETRKGMLTAEYVLCFHKLYKSTCALCAQPQLPPPRRVCPGEGRVCFRTLCRPDPGGGDRRLKIHEHCRVIWKLCPNRLPCIPALRQS